MLARFPLGEAPTTYAVVSPIPQVERRDLDRAGRPCQTSSRTYGSTLTGSATT